MLLSHLRGEVPITYSDFPYSRYHKTDDVGWMRLILEAGNAIRTRDIHLGKVTLYH